MKYLQVFCLFDFENILCADYCESYCSKSQELKTLLYLFFYHFFIPPSFEGPADIIQFKGQNTFGTF